MRVLVIGGAGFIGCHVVKHHLNKGDRVVLYDNFSRAGTLDNLNWLMSLPGAARLKVVPGDIQVATDLPELVDRVDVVYHLAAQVAVTTSLTDPRQDFMVNAVGTFNVLEAIRSSSARPKLIFASTNKVYGALASVPLTEDQTAYRFAGDIDGISEDFPLDFHSPYGCSKGAADQYVRDYSRIYGLESVVFRQSCVYGPRQFGVEDQGWLAYFAIRALKREPVTIYGTGKQVRDVLYIDDLVRLYDLAVSRFDSVRGRIYNVGGGPDNAVSILEALSLLERIFGQEIVTTESDWRPGDQPIFIADINKAGRDLGWRPGFRVTEGVNAMVNWILKNSRLFDIPESLEEVA